MGDSVAKILKLPTECVVEIMKELEYYDALRFRCSAFFANNIFYKHIKRMKGRELEVFLNIRNDQIELRYRSPKHRIDEAVIIEESYWGNVLTNAKISLSVRLGSNILTDEQALQMSQVFSKSKMLSVNIFSRETTQSISDLLYALQPDHSNFFIHRLRMTGFELYPKFDGIKIGGKFMFFEFDQLMQLYPSLPHLKVNLTLAAVPSLKKCIEQWRSGTRVIIFWDIYIPAHNFVDVFNHVNLVDWRRRIVDRADNQKLTISVSYDGPTPEEITHIRLQLSKFE